MYEVFELNAEQIKKLKAFIEMTGELSFDKEMSDTRLIDNSSCSDSSYYKENYERIDKEKQERDDFISEIKTMFGL